MQTACAVLAIHGLALWLLLAHFTNTPTELKRREIQVVLLSPAAPIQRLSTPVPAPTFISPAADDPREPEIDIRADPSNDLTASIVGEAMIVPPRPDPAFTNVSPALPASFQKPAKRYQVDLVLRVETDGHVGATKIAHSCGDSTLDDLAQQFAAANWRFRPALQNGVTIAQWTTVLVTFQQTS